MNIIRPNPNALDHKAVAKQFGMKLEYIGFFPVGKEKHGKAVYKVLDAKDEKEFFVLDLNFHDNKVTKHLTTRSAIVPFAKLNAIHCLNCQDVLYSIDRHDFRGCSCKSQKKQVFIDGGKDYCKVSGDPENFEMGIVDLVKGIFKVAKKEEENE
jgi:hypothetical protein